MRRAEGLSLNIFLFFIVFFSWPVKLSHAHPGQKDILNTSVVRRRESLSTGLSAISIKHTKQVPCTEYIDFPYPQ